MAAEDSGAAEDVARFSGHFPGEEAKFREVSTAAADEELDAGEGVKWSRGWCGGQPCWGLAEDADEADGGGGWWSADDDTGVVDGSILNFLLSGEPAAKLSISAPPPPLLWCSFPFWSCCCWCCNRLSDVTVDEGCCW